MAGCTFRWYHHHYLATRAQTTESTLLETLVSRHLIGVQSQLIFVCSVMSRSGQGKCSNFETGSKYAIHFLFHPSRVRPANASRNFWGSRSSRSTRSSGSPVGGSPPTTRCVKRLWKRSRRRQTAGSSTGIIAAESAQLSRTALRT